MITHFSSNFDLKSIYFTFVLRKVGVSKYTLSEFLKITIRIVILLPPAPSPNTLLVRLKNTQYLGKLNGHKKKKKGQFQYESGRIIRTKHIVYWCFFFFVFSSVQKVYGVVVLLNRPPPSKRRSPSTIRTNFER